MAKTAKNCVTFEKIVFFFVYLLKFQSAAFENQTNISTVIESQPDEPTDNPYELVGSTSLPYVSTNNTKDAAPDQIPSMIQLLMGNGKGNGKVPSIFSHLLPQVLPLLGGNKSPTELLMQLLTKGELFAQLSPSIISKIFPHVMNLLTGNQTAGEIFSSILSEDGIGEILPSIISWVPQFFIGASDQKTGLQDMFNYIISNNGLREVAVSYITKLFPSMKGPLNSLFDMITLIPRLVKNPVSTVTELLDIFPSGVSDNCRSDLEDSVISLADGPFSWGWQMLDSIGKPPSGIISGNFHWVGDFWQCLDIQVPANLVRSKAKFVGEYCLTVINFQNMSVPHDKITLDTLTGLYVGTCFPSSCSKNDVTLFYEKIEKFYDSKISLVKECQTKEGTAMDSTATIITLFLLIPVVLVILSTIYIYCQRKHLVAEDSEQSTLSIVCNIFCAQNTYRDLVGQPNAASGDILCLYSIRMIASFIVIWLHVTKLAMEFQYNKNVLNYLQHFDHVFQRVEGFSYCIFVPFFMLIGFGFTHINTIKSKAGLLIEFVSQYIRLTFPYFFMVLFLAGPFYSFGQGPAWPLTKIHLDECQRNWPKRILNLVKINTDYNRIICPVGEWYQPVAFLIHTIALFVILLTIRMPNLRKVLNGLLFLVPLIYLCVYLVINNDILIYMAHERPDISTTFNNEITEEIIKHSEDNLGFYFQFWIWLPSFVCGLISSHYIYHSLKKNNIAIPKFHFLTGFVAITSVIIFMLYYSDVYFYMIDPPRYVEVIHAIFTNTLWPFTIHWVILHCETFPNGLFNRILSIQPFIFLGKISYSVFITHFSVILLYNLNVSEPRIATYSNKVFDYVIVLTLTVLSAMVLFVLIESPVSRLLSFMKKKTTHSSNNPKSINTHSSSA